jgi:hypothetical protein
MMEQDERDTWHWLDHYIDRLTLYGHIQLTTLERGDLVLLLRRYRKQYFGSALTDEEQKVSRAEINP